MELEATHEERIVSRDLKPARINVALDGFVKDLDFGLAEAIEETQAEDEEESRR